MIWNEEKDELLCRDLWCQCIQWHQKKYCSKGGKIGEGG